MASLSYYLVAMVSVVFATKPTVDALSLLLFMGEYRQYMLAFMRAAKRRVCNICSFKVYTTKVEHLPSHNTAASVAPTPIIRTIS